MKLNRKTNAALLRPTALMQTYINNHIAAIFNELKPFIVELMGDGTSVCTSSFRLDGKTSKENTIDVSFNFGRSHTLNQLHAVLDTANKYSPALEATTTLTIHGTSGGVYTVTKMVNSQGVAVQTNHPTTSNNVGSIHFNDLREALDGILDQVAKFKSSVIFHLADKGEKDVDPEIIVGKTKLK